ncbi:Secreted protein [Tsukamurella ocularis]
MPGVHPSRRRFLAGAAGAGFAAVVATTGAGRVIAEPAGQPGIRTRLAGVPVSQASVRAWERRRVPIAAVRLLRDHPGVAAGELRALVDRGSVAPSDLPAARADLARTRDRLGADRIREMLAPETAIAGAATLVAKAASGGRWAIADTEITAPRGTAEGMAEWFTRERTTDDRPTWTGACPDHYVIVTGRDGRQEVIEVTGGAVLPLRFFVDYADVGAVPIPRDPTYPLEVAGTASLATGEMIGGVRHQFRTLPGGGFRSRLRVAFPAAVPGLYVTEHQWHLAVEFGNWVDAYLASA